MNRRRRRAAGWAAGASTPEERVSVEALRLHEAGQLDSARALYLKVLAARPDDAETLMRFGVLNHQQGRSSDAVELIARAIAIKPDFPEAFSNLGGVLAAIGRFDEAAAAHRSALALAPAYAEAANNLGIALKGGGRLGEAVTAYRQAIAIRPGYAEAHNNLGAALMESREPGEAVAACRSAIALQPDYAEAHHNLGAALLTLGHPTEAAASFRVALRLQPAFAEAHTGLGAALKDAGNLDEAVAAYRRAISLRPDLVDAHIKLTHALLLGGRLAEGWGEWEWRWKTDLMSKGARGFAAPLWSGEPIGDRTILLHAEQGLGDTLQFCRYAPMVPGRVVLEAPASLARLLAQLPGVARVVDQGEPLPPFDLHCPLMSLPRAFGTTLETIPGPTPYLSADPALAATWRARLEGLEGLRVGLAWAGSLHADVDARRSVAPAVLGPLADAPGVSFVSLQKGEPADQANAPPPGMTLHDFTGDLHDFADTAALIDGLDLVISVDTAVVHLAGAMGKPVWLLNRYDTCWRWLLRRDDSPWYPTLRQFRQPTPGDWASVIGRVRAALQGLASLG